VPVGAAVQEEAEPVVGEVAVAVPDAFHLLDQTVDRFGGSVGDAAGVEVGEQFGSPGVQGAGEADQFGDLVLGDGGEPAQQPAFGPSRVGSR
jgi:hypothetical protein